MTNNQEVIKELESITLAHMELPIETDDFMMTNDGLEGKRMALYVVQRYFQSIMESVMKTDVNPDRAIKRRSLAYAKWYATKRLNIEMPKIVETGTAILLRDAANTGYYKDLAGEYDTLQEFLASMYDDHDPHSSTFSTWSFIGEDLLPLAQSLGIEGNLFMIATSNIRKIRDLVPAARKLLRNVNEGNTSPKKAKEVLESFLIDCANPEVSVPVFREKLDNFRGISRETKIETGFVMTTGPDQYLICIPIFSKRALNMITMALRGRTELQFSDISKIFSLAFGDTGKETDENLWTRVKDMIGGKKND